MRGLFGRQAELKAIFSALGGGLPVEIIGRPGIGKTALLRSLAYHPAAAAFADGATVDTVAALIQEAEAAGRAAGDAAEQTVSRLRERLTQMQAAE